MNASALNRRDILLGAAAAALAAPAFSAAEPPPETKRIRLARFAEDVSCASPLWVAEPLLRAEGFEDLQYVNVDPADSLATLAAGQSDIDLGDPRATRRRCLRRGPTGASSTSSGRR
jgi:NitT/TauT family transport system substrate-binding protein